MNLRYLFAVMAVALSMPALSQKQLLWGDTHLHTTYSSDAFANNNLRADPESAFRYASGLPTIHPYHNARVQIETPLDFLVVSDHAEFLGVIRNTYFNGVDKRDVGFIDGIKADIATWILRRSMDKGEGRSLFVDVLPDAEEPRAAAQRILDNGVPVGWLPPQPQVEVDTWNTITGFADKYNNPGEFSALIGWEWSSIPGGANLHRVVITSAGASTAQQFQPFGLDDSPFPEDLWAWLESTSSETGADFIAIPHNSNISKGYMFDDKSLRGDPIDADYAARRMKWEMVAEITQIKGDSETHPDLSPDDPFAEFETYPFYIQRETTPYKAGQGDYIRPALRRGLALERSAGMNPYQFGLIGSTDAHTAMASAEEDNFHGKLATDSIPANKTNQWGRNNGVTGWDMSASGLAAVWAEENTRESILAAMKRREVYATSGPRIGVQFYAGWGLGEADLGAENLYAQATSVGVPMGGELRPTAQGAASPGFIVQATKDPLGVNLDRVQIVKGWIDAAGETHEKVFDVAWGGDDRLQADGSLAPVGNTVDVKTASVTNGIGEPMLITAWSDPEFDASQSAFYYARVLQIPTPRHSLYDAIALKRDSADDQPDTIQERAYTSPIWYHPVAP
jgi:hypothetical protein